MYQNYDQGLQYGDVVLQTAFILDRVTSLAWTAIRPTARAFLYANPVW